tara:strand:- start:6580 stop:7833 length:1254 start_codon:yes stop_codon:yes gene_type:complete
MSSRTRVISQSKAVYASPTGILPVADIGGSAKAIAESGFLPQQLHRVDTFSFDIDIAGARQDIREFGQLARIGTITMSELNPSFSLGYFLGNGENEGHLGFNPQGIANPEAISSQFISGAITEEFRKREKNLFVLTAQEGEDAFQSTAYTPAQRAKHDVVGFGNATVNSYTVNFAVGEIPRVDIEGEASNIQFYENTSSGLSNPSLNRDGGRADTGKAMLEAGSTGDMNVLVLRPEDVTLSFSDDEFSVGGTNLGDMHVQSASIEVPMSRTNISALGAERAVAKPLDFPINVTMSVSALLKNIHAGAVDMILTGVAGDETTNISLTVKDDAGSTAHKYVLQKATLDNQSFSVGLDDNETVDLTFSAQIGGPTTTDQGLFYSGTFAQNADFITRNTVANTVSGLLYKKNDAGAAGKPY